MSLPTLFVPDLAERRPGDEVEMDAEETGHLRALRVSPGDRLALTDGRGSRWIARLEADGRRSARCTLLSRLDSPSPLPVELAFAVAAKSRTLWLVEKAVELGVRSLQPLTTARSRSVADAAGSDSFWRRAERRGIAALKQSGGAWLPKLAPPVPLERYLSESGGAAGPPSGPRIVLDREGEPLSAALRGWSGGEPARFLIGPEGGLEGREWDTCVEAGWRSARLGSRTLRFETAAIACLAAAALHMDTVAPGREPAGGA